MAELRRGLSHTTRALEPPRGTSRGAGGRDAQAKCACAPAHLRETRSFGSVGPVESSTVNNLTLTSE